ncbi:ribosome maturation factor RimP [Desulfovibrio sp. ZJ369]|uniref:ribosome maturation factor RimP n=1 Tax=Desulfovibrio sp. ZJ369 TaxID=2709793 RepID=UPI0013EC199D|nr:ribosome maturation factor RimP [Desulfovibrio sp. ZJ369]
MTENDLKENVIRLADPVARSLGLIIWGVEISRAGRMILRLFVDVPRLEQETAALQARPDRDQAPIEAVFSAPAPSAATSPAPASPGSASPSSASIDQCEEISRHLALALEVEDIIPDPYVLEVSTPGLTRTFFSLAQMRPYLGDMVEARLHAPLAPQGRHPAAAGDAGRRIWRGRLAAVEEDGFVLEPALVSPDGEVQPEDLPPVLLPWQAVRKASRMHIFCRPGKPGKQPGKKTGKAAGKKTGKTIAAMGNTAD